MVGEPLEVLHRSGQQELIFCPREAAQSQPRHRLVLYGFSEQPLDLLSITGRLVIGIAAVEGTGMITGCLIDVTWDFS